MSILLILSACQSKNTDIEINGTMNPTATQYTNENTDNGYPIETKKPTEERTSNSYPISTSKPTEEIEPDLIPALEIPTPSADSGVIHGMIYSLTNEDPITFTKIYLATKIPVDPGDEYMVSIQENSSPHAQSNGNGEFLITDIEPGEYILVLVTPVSTLPIIDTNNEQIEFLIKAGELIDFNDIYAYWPNF